MIKKSFLLGAIVSIITTNAIANQVITSQTYVDNQDALKVNIAQGVGTNNANVGKTLVVNSSGNLELGTVSADNFVEDSITDGVTDKAPSENAVNDALAEKQDIIPAGSFGANNSVVTYGDNAGDTQERLILHPKGIISNDATLSGLFARGDFGLGGGLDNMYKTQLGATDNQYNYALLPAIYISSAFRAKQAAINGTVGSVPVFNGASSVGGSQFTERAIYDGSTTYDSTTDADKLITAGAVESKQAQKVCVRWIENAEQTDANCLLWNLP